MKTRSAVPPLLARSVGDFLCQHAPFAQMEARHLAMLAECATLNYFAHGTRLLGAADGAPSVYYVILRGEVNSAPAGMAQSGAADTAALHAGESFPLGALVEGCPVVNDYVARGDTFCYEFDKTVFEKLMAESAPFASFCTRRVSHLLQESRRQARALAIEETHAQHNMTSLLSALLRRAPVACAAQAPLREVLTTMHDRRIGSIVAIDDAARPVGILTERDVLDRIVLAELSLDQPLASVMTADPHSIDENASAFDAALLMARHVIRHLPVTRGGVLVGVVSERDLFALQRVGMRDVGRAIKQAAGTDALAAAAANVRTVARNLLAQGMAVEQLTQLIVALNDRLVERAIEISAQAAGVAATEYCWIALGSEGRMEQTISTDQDNGLIFTPSPGTTAAASRSRLLAFATRVNDLLARLGFPLCQGGIMAGNPKWCLSAGEWREKFSDWLRNPTPDALLNAAIFFDFRPLHGNMVSAEALRAWLCADAAKRPAFMRMLAANALNTNPPLNMFGALATSGRVDLKGQGARPFIDAARVLALAEGIAATHTAQRLRLAAARHGFAREVEAVIEAFQFIQALRLARQFASLEDGGPPNQIEITSLNELDRRILKESFRQARKLQSRLKLDFTL